MAIQARRERQGRFTDLWNRPIEWLYGLSLRPLEWFNQERWATLLTILALILANLVILFFFLQGQDNRAIAFVILALIAPLVWLIPELGAAVFIIAGSSLYVNAMYFAAGPGFGTGERTLIVFFLGLVSARAIYEYARLPKAERPRIFSWFVALILLFWAYYMGHVAYIYLWLYDVPPPHSIEAALGTYRPGVFRYLDAHVFWIGVLPLIVLLRDYNRARRTLMLVIGGTSIALFATALDYFIPLPTAWKIVFQIRHAGESAEGYRIAQPAVLHLVVLTFWYALYRIGFTRGVRAAWDMALLGVSVFIILVIKTRILWASILLLLPLVFLLKPPAVQARQLWQFGLAALLLFPLMLHPQIYDSVTKLLSEVQQRWQRNYAFGGDPRNDPSYLGRIAERDDWAWWSRNQPIQYWMVGAGLEAPYGRYLSVASVAGTTRFRTVYTQPDHLHFSWLGRLHRTGIIGVVLLAAVFIGVAIRSIQVYFTIKHYPTRALVFAIGATTMVMLGGDTISRDFFIVNNTLPIVLLWSVFEAALRWHKQGQLNDAQ